MDWPSVLEALSELRWLRLDLLAQLILASVLGGVVGLEREFSGKPAGFRTNLLICVGAALLTHLSIYVSGQADPLETNADPARIAAQIVSGIGFLGAGTIIQSRGSVVGLTTAATLWVVAAIGMAVGAAAYVEAVGATILVIAALILLGRLEERLAHEPVHHFLEVTLEPEAELIRTGERTLEAAGFDVSIMDVEKHADRYLVVYQASERRGARGRPVDPLVGLAGVRKVTAR